MQSFNLWNKNTDVTVDYYEPYKKASDVAVIIFPGGAYHHLAAHEGEGYAHMLNTFGISAFVVNYRVSPNLFPLPLLDARRAVRFVRKNASDFKIDKNKVLVMGSSAGGHLAALLSTYLKDIGEPADELLIESFLPNGQILCYPVISSSNPLISAGSYLNLLGEAHFSEKEEFSPELLVSDTTPPAFIWHTSTDLGVPAGNSLVYAQSLISKNISCELHLFPEGDHGLSVASQFPHVAQWTQLLNNWIKRFYI